MSFKMSSVTVSEILPVAQSVRQQQYLEPALRTIAASNGEGEERTVKAVKYVDVFLPAALRFRANFSSDK